MQEMQCCFLNQEHNKIVSICLLQYSALVLTELLRTFWINFYHISGSGRLCDAENMPRVDFVVVYKKTLHPCPYIGSFKLHCLKNDS